jgi:signal transduction histidine kinase
MNIYRIIQEAINNALKYADANAIDVQFKKVENELFVSIIDNGKGFDPTTVEEGNGLNNMKKRAHEIDGNINIHSETSKGTTVQLQMPIKA